VHTIGESAALGAAGIILWGGYEYSDTKVSSDFSVSVTF
jgi:hyaluronoglucosaminidase